MGLGLRAQVGLDDDDDIQWVHELLVEQLRLVQTGLDVPFHGGLFEVLRWHVGIVHLAAILTPGPSPGIGAGVGEVQGGIAPQLGNEVQIALPRHLHRVVVAKVTIQDEVGQWNHPSNQCQQGVEHAGDAHALWRGRDVGFGFVLAALRTPWTAFSRGWFLLLGVRFGLGGGFLGVTTDHLLDAQRKRAPCLGADQRQREKGQARHRLAVQTGEEAIQAIGVFARFGVYDFIARQQVDVIRPVHMLTKEYPKQHCPRERLGEKALDRTITTAWACPAGEAQHGHSSCHPQYSQNDPPELALGCRSHMGVEALEKCYTVHRGLLRRLRVGVVVDSNSTTTLRQKPFSVSAFWRRYCTEETFLDPQFWQALGRALGWSEACDLAITCVHGEEECHRCRGYYWMYQWHCFIQALANGNTPEAFFERLTSSL